MEVSLLEMLEARGHRRPAGPDPDAAFFEGGAP